MTPRLGKSTDPSTTVLRCLVALIACVGVLAGCLVGAGDDSLVPAMGDGGGMGDAGARAADGPAGDVRAAEGGLDAGTDAPRVDATVQDASSGVSPDAGAQNASDGGGVPIAAFSPAPIAFGFVGCGTALTQSLNVRNNGAGTLGVSVTVKGPAFGSTPVFTVSPTILSLAHGQNAALTITATVPNTASAAATLAGSLNMFTTDPNNANVSIALSATSSGATLVVQQVQTGSDGTATVTFPATKVGTAAAPIDFWLVNSGNAPQTFTVGAVAAGGAISVDQIPAAGVTITLNQYATWKGTARFTPTTNTSQADAKASISVVSGVICESVSPLTALEFKGTGTLGAVTGYPLQVDFPAAPCGGNAPAPQTFSLVNNGPVPVVLLGPPVLDSDAGFAVTTPANTILPDGGTLTVTVTPPAFPSQTGDGGTEAGNMPAPITATLTLPSDSNVPISGINLIEKPLGASLIFDTKAPVGADAGASFGQFVLPVAIATSSPPQTFGVVNNGSSNSVADVTLSVTQTAAPDGGADASTDAIAIAGAPSPFTLDNGALVEKVSATQGGAEPQPTLTFTPAVAGDAWGQLAMTVDPNTTVLCAQLPNPIALHGIGSGGGLSISTPSGTSVLTFPAPCDGTTKPAAQAFTVMNSGDKSLEWTMSAITGPGAAQYQVSAVDFFPKGSSTSTPLSTQAGVVQLLGPGDSAKVFVKVPLPMQTAHSGTFTAPSPAALAAQLTVTTNVPGANNSAVISLNEIPVGDQLFASLGPLGPTPVPLSSIVFGSASVGSLTPPSRTFVLTNSANPGSADARFSYVVMPATPTVYFITGTSLPAGHAATETITFTPLANASYLATLKITQTDTTAPLCAPLPAPIALSGTGTQGLPAASPATLVFGTGPTGLVNCGATGPAQSFTVTNNGEQAFNITGLTFMGGANSPFMSTTPTATLMNPIPVAKGQTVTITVTPKPIPQSLAQPSDVNKPGLFSDVLTVTTDAFNAAPATIQLLMQAQGAIIVDSQPPLDTNWAFGTVTAPSTSAQIIRLIQNIGTLPAKVTLATVPPQVSPSVFGLATAPTPVPFAMPPFNGVTSIVGQFTVPAASPQSMWVGDETLTVTADAFCEPLPAQWGGVDGGPGGVAIHMTGSYVP